MIGALYIVLLGVCATLYVESQSKQRDVYIWRLCITSMAAIVLVSWLDGDWRTYCYAGVAMAGLMVFANHGWPKKGNGDESWGTWAGRSALYNLIAAMAAYATFVLLIASPEPGENDEWLLLWVLAILMFLYFTYTKRGAQFLSDMIKHRSRR